MDCVFCRILRRESPGSFVYEDGDLAAFLDLFPVNSGHALVVPKSHIVDLTACPPELTGKLFQCAQRIAPAIVAATDATGFNVWTANGRDAGQDIFHLHLHVLPRFNDDSFGLRFPRGYPMECPRGSLDAMAATIRDRL